MVMITHFLIQNSHVRKLLLLTSRLNGEYTGMKKLSFSKTMESTKNLECQLIANNKFSSVPNILIVTNIDEDFHSLQKTLSNVLDLNRYVIYQFDSYVNSQYIPTKHDTSLIIKTNNSKNINEQNYAFSGSSLYSMFNKGLNVITESKGTPEYPKEATDEITVLRYDGYQHYLDTKGNCSLVKVHTSLNSLSEKEWIDIFKSSFPLIKLQFVNKIEPDLSIVPVVNFFGDPEILAMLKARSPVKQIKLQLDFNPSNDRDKREDYLSVNSNPTESFNWDEYQSHLKTKSLGRNLIHCNVISSTFDLLQGKFLQSGLVVIADQQTSGKGRSGNKWLSPKGCAMFSLQLELSLSKEIGQHLPLLQHLVSLAVVDSVNSIGNGYENLDLRLKWPNDIYAGQYCKIGGVVVYTSIMGTSIYVNIGCGVNLSNEEPTKSINQMAKEKNLQPISRESFLSHVFNKLESFLDTIGRNSKMEKEIFEKYHKYWLHSNQSVILRSEDGCTRQGRVISLDPDGFLLVDVEGKKLQVHPDGNSFDMLQGLILPKQ